MTRIIYNKKNGLCIGRVNDDRDIMVSFSDYPDEFKNNLVEIYVENSPTELKKYKVIDGELIQMTKEEIFELREYNKILTEEERQLQKLKPSSTEVKKAENTIEILTLLQEVM